MKKVISAILIATLIMTFPPNVKKAEAGFLVTTIIIAAFGFAAYKIFILCLEIKEFQQALLNELTKNRKLKEIALKELRKFINDPRWEKYDEAARKLLELIESGNYSYQPVDLNIGDLLKNPNFDLDKMLADLRNRYPNPIINNPIINPIVNPEQPIINPPISKEPIDEDYRHLDYDYSAFWKERSMDSDFTSDFNDRNIKDMEKGYAPVAPMKDSYGISRSRYEVHFTNGKPTYNMRRIQIVTPKEHYQIRKNDPQKSSNESDLKSIISRLQDVTQNWVNNYSELVYLKGDVHPDLYNFTLKYQPSRIENLINDYSQTTYDPYSEKEDLRNIYNDLLNTNYSQGSPEYLAAILDKSFFLDKSSIYYIYLPNEIDSSRNTPFTFDEFYQIWNK